MSILAVRRRALGGAALLLGFVCVTTIPALADDPPETQMAALARTADAAKTKVLAARDRVASVEQANGTATDDRKTKEKGIEERKRAVSKRIKSAASAFKKYQAAEKSGKVTDKEVALLMSAQADYQGALADGKAITADVAALRKAEDDIEGKVEAAQADVDAATAAATDAKTAAKSSADLGRTVTRAASDDAKQTKKDADKTKNVAGLGPAADYPKKRAKNQENDAKVLGAVTDAGKALQGLPKAAAGGK
ncbi:MAG TPA: hypothetical protein VHE30_13875 [Polyangiaceae bacterium]|nr:hypothetical protein [Polyangiaceae bacterium]